MVGDFDVGAEGRGFLVEGRFRVEIYVLLLRLGGAIGDVVVRGRVLNLLLPMRGFLGGRDQDNELKGGGRRFEFARGIW